mmetsp:Transcript_19816/g.55967  ORF Transcript_19816/g.55967 Transcript_19816/m.55967 type:complete len:245 (+) Transcript_19816:1997-2731(+)
MGMVAVIVAVTVIMTVIMCLRLRLCLHCLRLQFLLRLTPLRFSDHLVMTRVRARRPLPSGCCCCCRDTRRGCTTATTTTSTGTFGRSISDDGTAITGGNDAVLGVESGRIHLPQEPPAATVHRGHDRPGDPRLVLVGVARLRELADPVPDQLSEGDVAGMVVGSGPSSEEHVVGPHRRDEHLHDFCGCLVVVVVVVRSACGWPVSAVAVVIVIVVVDDVGSVALLVVGTIALLIFVLFSIMITV